MSARDATQASATRPQAAESVDSRVPQPGQETEWDDAALQLYRDLGKQADRRGHQHAGLLRR